MSAAFTELERGVYAALEAYSNSQRGSGHGSLVSTRLYEQARDIVLVHVGLGARKHALICGRRGRNAPKRRDGRERSARR